jgi:hypothetical protein
MFSVTVFLWLVAMGFLGRFAIIAYWDGPNYIYAAMTLYRIPRNSPITRSPAFQPSYFACHLPGFPLAIRLAGTLLLSHFGLGMHLAILFSSMALTYVFRRLLILYNASHNPVRSSILLAFIPIRFVIYHTVGASEPLFLVYCFLAFIFFRVNLIWPLVLSMAGAMITRIEGLALLGTIGLCYCLRFDILRAVLVGLTISAPAALLAFHHLRFGDWLTYYRVNQGRNKLLSWPPFREVLWFARNSDDVNFHLSALGLFVLFAVGVVLVIPVSFPFAVFSIVYVVFVSVLFHMHIYRYALPGYVFAVFVGFDEVWASKAFARAWMWIGPGYLAVMVWYAVGQIGSNAASSWFVQTVLNAPVAYY